jgi:CubicO group peptidase (beta-lactamase class C family)
MSPQVSDLTARRLQALISQEQSHGRLPSLVAGIVRDGALAWVGSCGRHTGVEDASADLQYRIGSITKTMTAVLVMQLRDEGALDLADRLDQHLPGIGYGDRTIRSLLSHSSGMQSEPSGPWWERSPGVTFEQLSTAIDDSQAPLAAGSTYHYTNLAFALLGEVVARLRGSSWWQQVQDRILTPLGMSRTTYLSERPFATGYSVHHFAGTLTREPHQDTGAMAPAGQLWSTLEDLARYASFLVGGHEEVLGKSTVDELTIPQSGVQAVGLNAGYGLGLRLVSGGSGTLVGHTGSMPGFLAGLFVDRVRRTGAVCLANGTSGMRCEGLPIDMLRTVEELEPTIPDEWSPAEHLPAGVTEILGVWHWGNTAFAFSYSDGEFVVTQLGSGLVTYRFRPVAEDTFVGTAGYHHGEKLYVMRNDDGSINHLECATFVYTRSPYDPEAPIPGGHP